MKLPAIVCIQFYDHCMFSGAHSDPIQCEVFGVLHKETKHAYYIASWVADGKIEDNSEQYCILKGVVKSVKRLRLVK